MSKDIFISVVIPAFNELEKISSTVTDVIAFFESRNYSFEIIASVDGNDGTRERLAKMATCDNRIQVIGGTERRGKGIGVRQAMSRARGNIVGFIDADNKTPITEFDKFCSSLSEGNEVVIGSRAVAGALIERAQPWYRRLGSMGFGWFMHMVIGLWDIKDTQCGFKFFRREAAGYLFKNQKIDGYMFDVEILYLAKLAGYRIAQIPVRWRDDGDSRLDLFCGNVRNVRDIFRIRSLHRPSNKN